MFKTSLSLHKIQSITPVRITEHYNKMYHAYTIIFLLPVLQTEHYNEKYHAYTILLLTKSYSQWHLFCQLTQTCI